MLSLFFTGKGGKFVSEMRRDNVPAVHLENITKRFGSVIANNNISLFLEN